MNARAWLDRFLLATSEALPEHTVLRALTWHMLEHVGPALFDAKALQLELERCADIALVLDGDGSALEIGIDAWFARHLHGLPSAPVDRDALHDALHRLENEGEPLHAWLLGEMAARCGVDARLPFPPRPFRTVRLYDAYFLTHLVLLDTDYFAKPLTHPDAEQWLAAIADLLPWLERRPNADLLGEVVLCLRFAGRNEGSLAGAEPIDAHSTATLLLAHAIA